MKHYLRQKWHVIELLCYNWRFANFWLEIWSHNWRFFIDIFDACFYCLLMFSVCLFRPKLEYCNAHNSKNFKLKKFSGERPAMSVTGTCTTIQVLCCRQLIPKCDRPGEEWVFVTVFWCLYVPEWIWICVSGSDFWCQLELIGLNMVLYLVRCRTQLWFLYNG
jgi:hypothetical protein